MGCQFGARNDKWGALGGLGTTTTWYLVGKAHSSYPYQHYEKRSHLREILFYIMCLCGLAENVITGLVHRPFMVASGMDTFNKRWGIFLLYLESNRIGFNLLLCDYYWFQIYHVFNSRCWCWVPMVPRRK